MEKQQIIPTHTLAAHALAELRLRAAAAESARAQLQAYLDGIIAGMGLDGRWTVDLETGTLHLAPGDRENQ